MSHTIHGYASSVAFQVHQMIKTRLAGYHVGKLHVEIEPPEANSLTHITAVTITGDAGSYHAKQLAQEALRTQRFIIYNQIEVARRK